MPVDFIAAPAKAIKGEVRVPGDKSISHRAVMLGSIAEGMTEVSGFLSGADAIATMNAFRMMGVSIDHQGNRLRIHGVGRNGLRSPKRTIDLGNSGTAMRLIMGLLAGQRFDVSLTGDASLCARPMARIANPLAKMGANIVMTGDRAPLTIKNTARGPLKAIDYPLPMASAQVKSALLLAGLYAPGRTCVIEPAPTRDHTERMLNGFGCKLDITGSQICLSGGQSLIATDIDIPADISSAAFFIVAAVITPESELCLRHVGVNPTRIGIINILKAMGARITLKNERVVGGEPVADIWVQGGEIQGVDIPEKWVPLAIDELPVIAIAAACANGVTRLSGAQELRVKESDRIKAIVSVLEAMAVACDEKPDGFVVHGKGDVKGAVFSEGEVHSYDDHRIAMAASIASLRASGPITIRDCDNVDTSFPGYVELANSIGLQLSTLSRSKYHES